MKAGLIVDNPKRDLKGLVLVAEQLIQLGYEVVLIPMYYQTIDTFVSGVDVLVINYARINNRRFLESCSTSGVRVIVMDTEGGILSEDNLDSPENWAKHLQEEGLTKLLAGYCFWGSATFLAFREFSGMPAGRLFLTGCPRYDQCHAKWRDIRRPRYRNHVLVNMNFSAINPLFSGDIEAEKKAFLSVGWEGGYVDRLYSSLTAVFPRLVDEIKALAAQAPDRQFVIRSHPFENGQFYVAAFAGLANVVVDGEGDVFDAMADAGCILHLNCGTAIDAFMMGVLPVSLEYLNDAVMSTHTPLPSKVSFQARSRDDVLAALGEPQAKLAELQEARVFETYIEAFFHRRDGEACRRVAAAVEATATGARDRLAIVPVLQHCGGWVQRVYRLAGLLLGTGLINRLRLRASSTRKSKDLDRDKVAEILADIRGEAQARRVEYAPGLLPFTRLASVLVRADS